MNRTATQSPAAPHAAGSPPVKQEQSFVLGLWGVRYQVKDVERSVAFYTEQLGFKLDHQNLPAFGQVSVANLKLILSGPGASGSRPMPGGGHQEPGGWNRVILQVVDLPGSSNWICFPPGPVSISLRKWSPAFFSAAIRAAIRLSCLSRLDSSDYPT